MARVIVCGWLGAALLAPLASFAKVQGDGGPIADVTLEQARVERAQRDADFARFCRAHALPDAACRGGEAAGAGGAASK